MVDFPAGTPDLPDIQPNDPPGTAAGGLGLRPLINRANDNIIAMITDQYNYPSLGDYNPIINGGPVVWPDAGTFAAIANDAYGPEMWKYRKAGAVVHTLIVSTVGPTPGPYVAKIPYNIQLDCTTADASIAATDYCTLSYQMEGFLWCALAERDFTMRFWVKGAKTGIHYVYIRNHAGDRGIVLPYTINAADTWEEKSILVPASPSAGTWNYINGRGVEIGWTLAAGTNFHVSAGAWTSFGDRIAAADQVNECDSTSNFFSICGFTVKPGWYCPPFAPRSVALEKQLCSRYYQKSYREGTAPGTNTNVGMEGIGMVGSGGTGAYGVINFRPSMRATPTITLYGKAGTINQFHNMFAGTDHNFSQVANSHDGGFLVLNNTTSSELVFVHYVANARMA